MKKMFALLVALLLCLTMMCSAGAETAPEFHVVSPNGAPGVALATLAVEKPELYTYVAAETIAAEFAGATSEFIIAPVNAGAKLYKAGKSTYRLAAVVTWGNLYIASQKPDFTLEDLKNGTLTLFGENTINASVALYALEKNGIVPAETAYLAGAANTQSLLLSDPEAMVITAEPALTAARMKNEGITAYAVNDLYEKATGFNGYTQAGLFVRGDVAEQQRDAVIAFLAEAKAAVEKCATDVETVAADAVQLELLPNPKVAQQAIPGCAIHYLSAVEAREQLETTAAIDLAQFGGAVPDDSFYFDVE